MCDFHLRAVFLVAGAAGIVMLSGPARSAATENEPLVQAESERIDTLVESLGSDRFFVREWAQSELAKVGLDAFDALLEAVFHEDIEIAARARYLLRSLPIEWTSEADHPAVRRILADYDALDETAREQRIDRLAMVGAEAGIEPLCRLIRFEESPVLSKRAALVLLKLLQSDDIVPLPSSKVILENVERSQRTSARWLSAYLAIDSDADIDVARFSELVTEEESVWRRWPQQSRQEIVLALLRFEAVLLERFGHDEQAMASMRRMIELETGETESLASLIQWFADRGAWSSIDNAVERFEFRFESDPLLLYMVAMARHRHDDPTEAQQIADEALALAPENLAQHLAVAREIQSRGMLDWAEREYELVVTPPGANAETSSGAATEARWRLAQMMHEREDHHSAAQLLQQVVDSLATRTKGKLTIAQKNHRMLAQWKARMHYYFACHFEKLANHAEQRKQLDAGLDHSVSDVDILISLYRLPDQDLKERARARGRVKQAIARQRQQAEQNPNSSDLLNEVAWLIASTEGDLDFALRCAQKSLEIQPGNASLMDTLALCHFARGEIQEALKYERLALAREPYSLHMQRQLDRFEAALRDNQDVPHQPDESSSEP